MMPEPPEFEPMFVRELCIGRNMVRMMRALTSWRRRATLGGGTFPRAAGCTRAAVGVQPRPVGPWLTVTVPAGRYPVTVALARFDEPAGSELAPQP
jgi:hypothetical protein